MMRIRLGNSFGIILASVLLMGTSGFTPPVNINEFGKAKGLLHDSTSKDRTPPVIQLLVNQPTGKNGWHIKPVFAKVKAFDEGSGVASAVVSLGGNVWYKNALKIDTDGEFLIIAKATDRAGNTSSLTQFVKIDLTPPEVDLSIPEPDGENGFYVSTVPILIVGKDETSGVAHTQIIAGEEMVSSKVSEQDIFEMFGGDVIRENWYSYMGTIFNESKASLLIKESGSYTIEAYVEDEAGNRTPINIKINVDMDSPKISIEPPKEYQEDIQLFGFAEDLESGINHVFVDYGIGWQVVHVKDGMWSATWPAGNLVEGKYPIKAKIIDRAGNESRTVYKAAVVNTFWPFFTFSALLIAAALIFALDPRKYEWAALTVEIEKHRRMYKDSLALELEEEFKDD
ncbi:MAG: Ig-like domain repeat protein [Anaerolineaceae bacterium]|nr:Ig-like domain repeat protein [Anaerolineaceae bacterium]